MSLERKLASPLALASLMLLAGCTGGTEVVLSNRSSAALQDVSVQFTGGATRPQTLRSRGSATLELNPTGESRLVIVYRSEAGPQACRIDTYLERDYRAEFHVDLHETSCRVTRQEVELPVPLGCPQTEAGRKAVVSTEEDAVATARTALVAEFGPAAVEKREPYRAELSGGIWRVSGTLPEGWRGGTPEAHVCASTGAVLKVLHGR